MASKVTGTICTKMIAKIAENEDDFWRGEATFDDAE